MNKALKEHLIKSVGAELNKNDFYLADSTNKYFIYHRKNNSRIEIVQIAKEYHETYIIVAVSVAYLNVPNEHSNINFPVFTEFNSGDYKKISADDCCKRYTLKGNFGNKFYYGDVYYALGYGIIGKSPQTNKPLGIRIKKYNSNTYNDICNLIIRRLPKAYKWLAKMNKHNNS